MPKVEEYSGYLSLIARIEILKCRAHVRVSDIVQETMTKAWKNRHQFKGETAAQFKCWLRTILAHNLCDAIRPRREIPLSVLLQNMEASSSRANIFFASQSSPSQIAGRREEGDRAMELLAQLPADQAIAVYLKHCEGWSVAQIGEEMGKTVAAVAGLLRRGLDELRDHLCKE